MPFNGSGTFSPAAGNPAVAGTTILSSLYNDTVNDLANALSNCVTRDGQGVMGVQLKIVNGTVSVPGLGFNAETSTGIYLPALTAGLAITSQGVEVARFKTSGSVLIGSTSDTGEKLQVTGTAKVTGNTTIGGTLGVTGAATLSSTATFNNVATFNAVPIFQTGAGSAQIEFRENDQTLPAGRYRWTLDGDQLSLRHNTAVAGDFSTYVAPISFSTTNNTTIWGNLNFSGNGNVQIGNSSTSDGSDTCRIVISTTATPSNTRGAWIGLSGNEAVTEPGTVHIVAGDSGYINLDGNVGTPYGFDVGTTLSVTGATTLGSTLSVTGVSTLTGVLKVSDGTAAAPGITFTTDTNTGFYRVGENQLGVAAGGALQLTVSNTAITSVMPVRVADGSATAPSYSFSSDTNTGLYWVSADTLGITTAGTQAATFDASGNTNIIGGLGVRAGVPSTAYGIVASYDRTVNSSTYGLHSTVNLTAATLTADRNNYGVYSLIEAQNQNAAAFSANVYGTRSEARTSATAGNSVNGEGSLYGLYAYANHQTADATYTRMENAFGVYGITQANGATSLIDQAYGVYSLIRPTNAGATINTGYLFYGTNSTVTGTFTSRWGVYIASDVNNYFTGGLQVGGTATGTTSAAGLGVGVAPPGTAGAISAGASITTATQFFGNTSDSVTAPSYTWSTDNNSGMYNAGADSIGFTTGGTNRVTVSTTAVTVANADTVLANTGPTSTLSAGFRGVPQSSQSANYTLVLADAGKHIYHPSGGGAGDVFTIPANASVAFPIGTAVTFVNLDSNTVSIAITTDTLYMAGSGSTGSRTLAQYGVATALKISSTTWLISGTGLT